MRIVVVLEGGLVRNIMSDSPIEVLVKDWDKGAEDELVCTHWAPEEIEVSPDAVKAEFAEFVE